jgi:drug/metabolite transporter (DMT)-like permease
MRALRNIAIIAVLALGVAVVPGGGNVARAVLAALTLCFLAVIGLAGYQIYRQNKLSYLSLTDRQRAVLVAAAGAIVLMIAGADELLDTGLGLLVWIGVLGLAVFSIFSVWTESQRY